MRTPKIKKRPLGRKTFFQGDRLKELLDFMADNSRSCKDAATHFGVTVRTVQRALKPHWSAK